MKYKPFLKWAGGKTQILDTIIDKMPNKLNNYIEPFLGGGSVLIKILELMDNKKIKITGKVIANDINESLIQCFIHLKNNCHELTNELDKLNDYTEKTYYVIREEFNKNKFNDVKKSAIFIYLNKICFRGLFRVGKNGFNVPYGHYKNPKIFDKDNLINLSKLFNKFNVSFLRQDFIKLKNRIQPNDFIYIDPPYYKIKKTSFTTYTKDNFNEKNHETLKTFCDFINKKKAFFIQSNSYDGFINKLYDIYNIETIECKRRINSKMPASKIREVLISNY